MTKTKMAMNMGSGAVDRYKNGGPIVYIIEGRSLSQDINGGFAFGRWHNSLKELFC